MHQKNVCKSDRRWEPEKFKNLNYWNFVYIKNEPRDMLNNFCFHVYAQKSLFIGENVNVFFDILLITSSCDIKVHRAGSLLKMRKC